MLKIPYICIKDKTACIYRKGALTFLGKPIDLAKEWKKEGIKLIHIVDLDAKLGSSTNFDVYDSLSYQINVQVEGVANEKIIKKLLSIGIRVVIDLPTKIDLIKFKDKKKLLVGRISSVTDISNVQDIILQEKDSLKPEEDPKILKLVEGRRLIVYGQEKRKIEVFGSIFFLK